MIKHHLGRNSIHLNQALRKQFTFFNVRKFIFSFHILKDGFCFELHFWLVGCIFLSFGVPASVFFLKRQVNTHGKKKVVSFFSSEEKKMMPVQDNILSGRLRKIKNMYFLLERFDVFLTLGESFWDHYLFV